MVPTITNITQVVSATFSLRFLQESHQFQSCQKTPADGQDPGGGTRQKSDRAGRNSASATQTPENTDELASHLS